MLIPPSLRRAGAGDSRLKKALKRGECDVWFILIPTGFSGPGALNLSGIDAQVHVFVVLKLFSPVGYIYGLPLMEITK